MWHNLTIQTEVGHIYPDNTDSHKDDVMGVAILKISTNLGILTGPASEFKVRHHGHS